MFTDRWMDRKVVWSSLVAQRVKSLPTMRGTQVQSLGQEDILEKEMATHSSILFLENPHRQRSLAGYSPCGCEELDPTEWLHIHIFTRDYYSVIKKNEIVSAIVMQMNLKYGIQSEVSQKEKNKYRILVHIYAIYKNGTNESICRAGTQMQTQRTDLCTQQGKFVLGRTKRRALTYILRGIKYVASGKKLLYGTGSSARCSVMT